MLSKFENAKRFENATENLLRMRQVIIFNVAGFVCISGVRSLSNGEINEWPRNQDDPRVDKLLVILLVKLLAFPPSVAREAKSRVI